MVKIVHSFSKKTLHEVEHEMGVRCTLSMEHLKGYLEVAGAVKDDEQLDGVIITENDITMKISKKV